MPHKGYKQSEEHKQKRIKTHVGKKRSKETKLKMSESHKVKPSNRIGKKLSKESKQKIRKALLGRKLSEEIKQKIRNAWIPNNGGRGKKGYHNGVRYDSLFELKFMQLLDEYKIPYERADNKNFRVKYTFENQEHYYYPDFYLPREESIVEIKAFYKLIDLKTKVKLEAAKEIYGKRFIIITEKELPELYIRTYYENQEN